MIVAGRTAGPQGGQNHPEASKCGKASRPAGDGRGCWVRTSGALGMQGGCPAGAGGEGKSQLPPPPPQAFRSRPAGPGVEGQLCAAQEEGAWGVTLPSAWANIRPLSWDGRPLPLRGGCGGILFIGSARRRSAHRPFPGQRWVRMGRRDPVAPTCSWVTGAG